MRQATAVCISPDIPATEVMDPDSRFERRIHAGNPILQVARFRRECAGSNNLDQAAAVGAAPLIMNLIPCREDQEIKPG